MRKGMRKDNTAFTYALAAMTWLKVVPDKVLLRAATPPPGNAYARKRRTHWLQNTWQADFAALRSVPNWM
jgi:hypothetical protein